MDIGADIEHPINIAENEIQVNFASSNKDSNTNVRGGRPSSDIWEYFEKNPSKSKGHCLLIELIIDLSVLLIPDNDISVQDSTNPFTEGITDYNPHELVANLVTEDNNIFFLIINNDDGYSILKNWEIIF